MGVENAAESKEEKSRGRTTEVRGQKGLTDRHVKHNFTT